MNWLNYFKQNEQHRLPIDWERGIDLEPYLRGPLIRSLQKFQLGESGEGRRLRRHAAATGDETYAAEIGLFVKEEQEHSRLMAEVLKQLKAPLLRSHWSDHCFVVLRHFFGLHQELMILLLPEMIAKRYFAALRDGTRDPVLKAVFAQIAQDEEGHLAFHVDRLHRAFESMPFALRMATQILWRVLFRATCLVVILDHRDLIRLVGVTLREFWDDCGRIFDEVSAGIFSPSRVLAPVELITSAK